MGGIKLEGLDRLRVTLKLEVRDRKFKHYLNNADIADLALRQNLDLYNDSQIEKLIRKATDRLEIGSLAIAKAIADITSQLEVYRLEKIEAEANSTAKAASKQLSEAERANRKGVFRLNMERGFLFTDSAGVYAILFDAFSFCLRHGWQAPYPAVDFYGLSKRIGINIFIFTIISYASKYTMD